MCVEGGEMTETSAFITNLLFFSAPRCLKEFVPEDPGLCQSRPNISPSPGEAASICTFDLKKNGDVHARR